MGKSTRLAAIAGLLISVSSVVTVAAGELRIVSPNFQNDATIPPEFTCDGAGMSPALQFRGAPARARSLVLIVVDPDVSKETNPDGRYLHWAVWDLAPGRTGLLAGQSARGLNQNGPGGYLPPCPKTGEHRYVFQLFAINSVLGDKGLSGEADLRRAMEGHVLDQAELVGRYKTRSFRATEWRLGGLALMLGLAVLYYVVTSRMPSRKR